MDYLNGSTLGNAPAMTEKERGFVKDAKPNVFMTFDELRRTWRKRHDHGEGLSE